MDRTDGGQPQHELDMHVPLLNSTLHHQQFGVAGKGDLARPPDWVAVAALSGRRPVAMKVVGKALW